MPTTLSPAPERTPSPGRAAVTRPAPSPNTLGVVVVLLLLLAASVWSTMALHINIASIIDSVDNAVRFVARMFPLDFPPLGELLMMIGETLAIVVLATALSVILSIPIALLAAGNTTSGRVPHGISRVAIVVARALPDLVLAIVFFRMFGLGAVPGILAMGLHSIGMVAKLYADAIEELDNGPQEAIRSAGGGRAQQILAGVLPGLLPQIVATALHRFDINLRTSVLLGYVGVGGIGLAIADALRALNYQRGMALALTVLALCIATELISGAVRTALMNRSPAAAAPAASASRPVTWADRVSGNWVTRGRHQAQPSAAAHRLTPPWNAQRVRRALWIGVVVVILAASTMGAELSVASILQGLARLPETVALFFPPATGAILPDLLAQLLITIQIALAATLLGTILAIPIGVLAARNVVGSAAVNTTFRVLIVIVRGIPELIVAIIFVVISGLGGVAGTLALTIGAVGLLSKLVADSLEETDVDVQEALRSSGATTGQVFWGATARQAAPAFVAHIMYLLDSNIRSATLLGVVGAGGIGYLLLNASRVQQFDVVTTIVLLILAVVLIVEVLAIWIRRTVR